MAFFNTLRNAKPMTVNPVPRPVPSSPGGRGLVPGTGRLPTHVPVKEGRFATELNNVGSPVNAITPPVNVGGGSNLRFPGVQPGDFQNRLNQRNISPLIDNPSATPGQLAISKAAQKWGEGGSFHPDGTRLLPPNMRGGDGGGTNIRMSPDDNTFLSTFLKIANAMGGLGGGGGGNIVSGGVPEGSTFRDSLRSRPVTFGSGARGRGGSSGGGRGGGGGGGGGGARPDTGASLSGSVNKGRIGNVGGGQAPPAHFAGSSEAGAGGESTFGPAGSTFDTKITSREGIKKGTAEQKEGVEDVPGAGTGTEGDLLGGEGITNRPAPGTPGGDVKVVRRGVPTGTNQLSQEEQTTIQNTRAIKAKASQDLANATSQEEADAIIAEANENLGKEVIGETTEAGQEALTQIFEETATGVRVKEKGNAS